GRENDDEKKRNVKKQIERHGRTENFGKIASGDSNFANDPEADRDRARVGFTASLGEIATGDDAEFGGQRLKEHRHQVAHEDDAEQRIAEFRAAAQVGGPIAWVHVTNGAEIDGAGE